MSIRTIRRYLERLGWTWHPTMGIGTGCQVHLLADELPAGRLIVSCSRHITAVIDGVIHDTFDPSREGTRVRLRLLDPGGCTMSTVLMTSVRKRDVTTEADRLAGSEIIELTAGGDPVLATTIRALEERYPRRDPDELAKWAEERRRVTFLRIGENMLGAPLITAEEGTLFPTTHAECVAAYLPKGKRTHGNGIRAHTVLDFVEGYGGADELRARLAAHEEQLPLLQALTRERLDLLPDEAPDPAQCTLACFGRWALPHDETATAVWLLHSYWTEQDIAEGVCFVPPQVGTSEHGSIYGRQLLGMACEVVSFTGLSLRDAVQMTNHEDGGHAAALELVRR